MRYLWYSVDSTSWMLAPTYGLALVPEVSPGSPCSFIFVATGHQGRARLHGGHSYSPDFEFLPCDVQARVIAAAAECGLTITDLRNDVYSRTLLSVKSLMLYQEDSCRKFKFRRGSFSLPDRPRSGVIKDVATDFHIVFAGNTFYHQDQVLVTAGAHHRLWSYYLFRDCPERLAARVAGLRELPVYSPRDRFLPKANWTSMNYHDHRRRLLAARGELDE